MYQTSAIRSAAVADQYADGIVKQPGGNEVISEAIQHVQSVPADQTST